MSSDPAKYNPFLTEDVSDWLKAIKTYVKETNVSVLNLSCKHKYHRSLDDETLDMPFEVVESVLKCLPNSLVTELHFDFGDFSKKRTTGFLFFLEKWKLCKLMKNTNIKKVSFGNRKLTDRNLAALLDVVRNSNVEDCGEFVFGVGSHEISSNLAKLNLRINCDWPSERPYVSSFANGLSESSLTSLRLIFATGRCTSDVLEVATSIFSKLPSSQIKELNLSFNKNGDVLLSALSPNLAASKLETLNICHSFVTDSGLSALAPGLAGSKVSVLNLSSNHIKGLNNFGEYVRRTSITVLNLKGNEMGGLGNRRNNGIEHRQMFDFPNFLAGSLVKYLDVSKNDFDQALSIELLNSLKLTNVTKLKISTSNLNDRYMTEFATALTEMKVKHAKIYLPGRAVEAFGELLKDSGINSIHFINYVLNPWDFISSLNWVKNSCITSLKLERYHFSPTDVDLIAESFVGTNITHLFFKHCRLNQFVTFFAPLLKNTSVTHLSFKECHFGDEEVSILARNLIGTKIVELNLSWNFGITSVGAEALSIHVPGTSVVSLSLHDNCITDEGFELLAKSLSDSFLTTLDVSRNRGRKLLRIQKMLFENRVRAHKLVAFFKRLFPEIGKQNLCISQRGADMSVADFFKACLTFYKMVVEQPAAVSVLSEEESVSLSRKELVRFFDNFPAHLSEFIGTRFMGKEVDVKLLIELMKKAEELGLSEIVEGLLLNRPLYYIDETKEILHPRVYALLLKYKLPVVNTNIEPAGVAKIINYFTENSSIDGSADLVNLLSSVEIS